MKSTTNVTISLDLESFLLFKKRGENLSKVFSNFLKAYVALPEEDKESQIMLAETIKQLKKKEENDKNLTKEGHERFYEYKGQKFEWTGKRWQKLN